MENCDERHHMMSEEQMVWCQKTKIFNAQLPEEEKMRNEGNGRKKASSLNFGTLFVLYLQYSTALERECTLL